MSDLAKARAHHEKNELKSAILSYEACLIHNPNDPDILRFLGLAFAQSHEIQRAIACFSKALMQAPHDPLLHQLLANAYKQTHAFDQALIHYEEATRLMPDNQQVYFNVLFYKGLSFLQQDKPDAAEIEFNLLLSEHPEHVGALVNLGVLALKRNQGQLAIDYFGKALAIDNHHEEARNNLAATFIHHDRFENALTHYTELLKNKPNDLEYHYNAGVCEMALGHLNKASSHFKTVLNHQPHHFAALNNSAAIALRGGHRQEAIHYLSLAHEINPQDKACSFLLNALTGKTKGQEACPDYVKNLFDHYALYYDQHMRGPLHYALPEHIAKLIHRLFANILNLPHTLDLGCGTGLCGNILREISAHLTGVDISSKMLDKAREKQLYDLLIEKDIISFLKDNTTDYDLIIAADVLPYFSDLDLFFKTISEHMTPNTTLM
ncbi:MAG: tetratricopeptide repeat protein, partial [Legionellaceae bacterium]